MLSFAFLIALQISTMSSGRLLAEEFPAGILGSHQFPCKGEGEGARPGGGGRGAGTYQCIHSHSEGQYYC